MKPRSTCSVVLCRDWRIGTAHFPAYSLTCVGSDGLWWDFRNFDGGSHGMGTLQPESKDFKDKAQHFFISTDVDGERQL